MCVSSLGTQLVYQHKQVACSVACAREKHAGKVEFIEDKAFYEKTSCTGDIMRVSYTKIELQRPADPAVNVKV